MRTPTFQSDESQEGATVWASEGEEEREERGQSERQMGEGACGARRGAPRPGDLPRELTTFGLVSASRYCL